MEAYRVEILNPKAINLLQDLVDLKLIALRTEPDTQKKFLKLLTKLRGKSYQVPSLEEIAKEVEIVRTKRYAKEKN